MRINRSHGSTTVMSVSVQVLFTVVTRCCGNSCQSRTYGMFIFVIRSGSLKYFRSSNKPLSMLSVLMCPGTHASRKGVRPAERNISVEFCYVNMTDSDITQDGNAFYVQFVVHQVFSDSG
jgi:hypothetical protein